jgi:hypothetical protein
LIGAADRAPISASELIQDGSLRAHRQTGFTLPAIRLTGSHRSETSVTFGNRLERIHRMSLVRKTLDEIRNPVFDTSMMDGVL